MDFQSPLAALAYSLFPLKTFPTNQTTTDGTGVHFTWLATDTAYTSNFQKCSPTFFLVNND